MREKEKTRNAARRRRLLSACVVALAAAALALAGGRAALAGAGEANGSTYVLTSFDGSSQFMGLNAQGKTFAAVYGSTTSFKLAVLDKYAPTDPCRTAAESYNTSVAVNDTLGFNTALSSMVTSSCKAKVLLSGTTIKTFQPVP